MNKLVVLIMTLAIALVAVTFVAGMVSFCSSPFIAKDADRESRWEAVGVHVGNGAFARDVLGKVGERGMGLIRVDWQDDDKDDILLLIWEGEGSATLLFPLPEVSVELLAGDLTATPLFSFFGTTYGPSAADMDGDGLPELCAGGSWTTDATVFSHAGDVLFTYDPYGFGTDEAMLADLKGDGHAVLIAGFNGDGGLRAASITGRTIFHDDLDLGNVWNVEAADLDGDGELEIINSWSAGTLEVWSSEFRHLRTLNPPEYVAPFATVDHDGDGRSEIMLHTGMLLDGTGEVIYPGDGGGGNPRPSFAITADISDSEGLETAWAQWYYNNLKIRAQDGTLLYHEGFEQEVTGLVTGLISTEGLEGWEPGFLVQLADGRLIHYTRAK